MKVVPFVPEHIDALRDFGSQDYLVTSGSREELGLLVRHGRHLSFFAEDVLIGCAGVTPVHEWRGIAWALLRSGLPESFLALHRNVARELSKEPYARIEAYVDPSFKPAVRWIKLLGFRLETPYKAYFFPDGRGASEWVRCNSSG